MQIVEKWRKIVKRRRFDIPVITYPSGEFCPACGTELEYHRSMKDNPRLSRIAIPRAKDCPCCGRRWITGEVVLSEYKPVA